MDDGRAQIIERGVLTASDETWDVAVRRAEVIGRWPLIRGWGGRPRMRRRAGEGVVSDLLPRRSSGGRRIGRVLAAVETVMAEVIRSRYLDR